ncbi:hypothetical protein ECE49_04290 [Helicobacter pylori]|nr:hypothetical protein ECE49_04290 [Helicobacter pylori]
MWIGKKSWIALLNSTKFLIRANRGALSPLILFNLILFNLILFNLILFNLILFNLILFNLGLAFMES